MQAKIGITTENVEKVVHVLKIILADEFILYTKTRNAHWNIETSNFYSMHKFFEGQYEQLDELIDDVAERIRALGHQAPATLKSYLELTHLTENSNQKNDSAGFISPLLEDHESIVARLRENINHFAVGLNDLGTSDFITGLMEKHEKMAWMLRAHLDD
jgi:starvation-inducible DNA-binding protein